MTENRLRTLLQLYYDGETTPEQERELAAFMTSDAPVAPEFVADREMFRALASARIPDGFDRRLEESVDDMLAKTPRRRLTAWIAGAAACTLLVGTAFEAYKAYDGIGDPVGLPQEMTAREIAENTEMALRKFNNAFGKGMAAIDRSAETTAAATETAFNKLNNI